MSCGVLEGGTRSQEPKKWGLFGAKDPRDGDVWKGRHVLELSMGGDGDLYSQCCV
jgi:hypothetical protein